MRKRLSITVSVATETVRRLEEHLDRCDLCDHYGHAIDHLAKLANAYQKLLEHTRRDKDATEHRGGSA